jgi:phage portal protein BeeE
VLRAARESLANFISSKRLNEPIDFHAGFANRYFGTGLGSHQPPHDVLLRESVGVSSMATRALSNRVGELNPQVKQSKMQVEGTIKDEILDDNALKLLLDRPHPNLTRRQMLTLASNHIVTVGEAYWVKVRNQLNVPMMLQPVPPSRVAPQISGGVISGYLVRDANGAAVPIEASEMIRFWFPDPESLFSSEGYLAPNGAIADAQKFANQHLRGHFQDDATPMSVLKASADAPEPAPGLWDRFTANWIRKHNARKGTQRGVPVVLPAGWDIIFTALQSGADITPLLDHWQSNQLMNFGVPPGVLGRVVSGDRSALETSEWVMDKFAVSPIASMISESLTLQLANDFDERIFVEFESFISDDKEFELKREAQDLTLKTKSIHQVLIERSEDPDQAPWGEFPVGTLADTPYTGEERSFPGFGEDPSAIEEPPDDTDEDPPEDPGNDEPRMRADPVRAQLMWSKELSSARIIQREKKFVPPFARAMRLIFAEQHRSVKKKLAEQRARMARGNPVDPNDLFDPRGWGDLFDEKTLPIRTAAFRHAAQEALELLGVDENFDFSSSIAQALRNQGAEMIKRVNSVTGKRITKAVREAVQEVLVEGQAAGDPLPVIAKKIDEIFKFRKKNSATIARTEMHRASQSGQLESFRQAAIPFKQWLDSRDSSVRDTHFQEGILPARLEQEFTLPSGWMCQYPGDSRLPAEESINCRCDAAPVFGVGDE